MWNLRNASAMQRLPPELLVLPFHDLDVHDRVKASHVCRHWRHVALANPLLWTAFRFPVRASAIAAIDMLETFLSRSGSLPFDFAWDRYGGLDLIHAKIQTALRGHVYRLKSITIRIRADIVQGLLDLLSQPAPQLVSITVFSYDGRFVLPGAWRDTAPNLHAMTFDGADFANIMHAFPSVTNLTLEPPVDARRLFDVFPCVRRLTLKRIPDIVQLPTVFPLTLESVIMDSADTTQYPDVAVLRALGTRRLPLIEISLGSFKHALDYFVLPLEDSWHMTLGSERANRITLADSDGNTLHALAWFDSTELATRTYFSHLATLTLHVVYFYLPILTLAALVFPSLAHISLVMTGSEPEWLDEVLRYDNFDTSTRMATPHLRTVTVEYTRPLHVSRSLSVTLAQKLKTFLSFDHDLRTFCIRGAHAAALRPGELSCALNWASEVLLEDGVAGSHARITSV